MTSAHLPTIAITMGDPSGIGPEIVAAAVGAPEITSKCRSIIIGDLARLELAAKAMNVHPKFSKFTDIATEPAPRTIEVIDLQNVPADLEWGVVSPAAGQAAFEYVRAAGELAMQGTVDAICTAPLNKAALHAAGHPYPGHTELLAKLTGTEEVSMMLTNGDLRVLHVTTHIGLRDAIDRINPGLVERTVLRGIVALRAAGITAPRVGVCAINPHAGENGLFGYGEEEEKIQPAIDALVAAGHNVVGPIPADTAFFLAGRGDFDLIVAMYHDQGHGPVKVLGIESGVNVTVGLPVIRTSVDHGTAFDIAGSGTAEYQSMVHALQSAVELAGRV